MSNLINENLINLQLRSTKKEDVIKELAQLIHAEERLISYDEYISEVFDREKKSSTGIGIGIAIPHGKCEAVKLPTLAFGRNNNGIEWEALDGEPVKIVFLLAVPCVGEECNEHLRILASISRRLLHEEFTNSLHNCNSKTEIIGLLSSVL